MTASTQTTRARAYAGAGAGRAVAALLQLLVRIAQPECGKRSIISMPLSQQKKNLYLINDYIPLIFAEYIQAAMDKATYEIIDDPEPFYSEVPELKGLWATGKPLEECRKNLMDALDDWIAAHLAWGYQIPASRRSYDTGLKGADSCCRLKGSIFPPLQNF